MAEARLHAARRPISRTYEGVQWFRHADGWRASIPGTPMAVHRCKLMHGTAEAGHFLTVEVYDPPHFVQIGAHQVHNQPFALLREELPWTVTTADSVRDASDLVKHLRGRINHLLHVGWWLDGDEVSA